MAAIALERLSGPGVDVADVSVSGVDLFVADGEWLVLTGPPGSGKGTLLDLIAGTRAPESGRVLIGGCDVTEERDSQRGLVVLRRPEEAPVEPRGASSFEWMWRRQTPPAPPLGPGVFERFRESLRGDDARERSPVLADEPLGELDRPTAGASRIELAALHAERPRLVVHSTCDAEEALALGHRVAVMMAGALVQVGPPLLVYERPAHLSVARFVGTPGINLFEGTVTMRGEIPVFDSEGQTLTELPAGAAPLAGRSMTLGVRPPDVELGPPGCGIVGITNAIEVDGPSQLAHIGLPGWLHVVAVLPARPLLDVGRRVDIRFRSDRVHLFNEAGDRYSAIDGVAT